MVDSGYDLSQIRQDQNMTSRCGIRRVDRNSRKMARHAIQGLTYAKGERTNAKLQVIKSRTRWGQQQIQLKFQQYVIPQFGK